MSETPGWDGVNSWADPFGGGLEGADKDAFLALRNLLSQWGLDSLTTALSEYIKQGYDGSTVAILLQETPEYKQRFKANEARRKAGLPVLSPAEYLSVESSYREIMSQAGLPPGFYDSPDDFTKWIENDVAPVEIKQRVDIATEMVNSIDPAVKQQWEQWYSTGDMVAYALDRNRATTVLDRQWRAAQVGGAAASQGLQVGQGLAESIAAEGISGSEARQGFGVVAREAGRAESLSAIYGGEDVTQSDVVQEVFFGNEDSARKRRKLASQERGAFSGSSGQSQTSLSRSDAGQL